MLTFTEDVVVPEGFSVKTAAVRNQVNVFYHNQYIGHVTDIDGLLFSYLFTGEDENGARCQNVAQRMDWHNAINSVITAYQQTNPFIVDRLPVGVDLAPNTVYFLPALAKYPMKVVARCEAEGGADDAEAIANFLRDRDGIYAYVWTNGDSKPTLLSNLK